MGKVLEMEAAQPAASTPTPEELEARIAALEQAVSAHNHGVSPELIAAIAAEAKKEVLAQLRRELISHLLAE